MGRWITRAIPWALLTFLTLGTAILMGGYWAYKTLGWGGYWGWDPVENTASCPGSSPRRSCTDVPPAVAKTPRRINLILACTAYASILYGTFLTRSECSRTLRTLVIDLGITGWLVGILASFIVLSVGLLAWRWRRIPGVEEDASPLLSRSVLFILGIGGVLRLGGVILLGTSALC